MTEEEEQIQKQLDEARKIKEQQDKQKEFDFLANQKYEMEYRNGKWVLVLKDSKEKKVYAAGSWRKI
jgi:hypothetical protein